MEADKYDKPLPTTNCTTTTMFLLLFHLAKHSFFLDLDKSTALGSQTREAAASHAELYGTIGHGVKTKRR